MESALEIEVSSLINLEFLISSALTSVVSNIHAFTVACMSSYRGEAEFSILSMYATGH